MDNETRNNRIQDLTDAMNQNDNNSFDMDDFSSITDEDLSAPAESIDKPISTEVPRSQRVASSMRSGSSNRVRSIDMSDIDVSSSSGSDTYRRSVSSGRTASGSSSARSSSARSSSTRSSSSRTTSSRSASSSRSSSGSNTRSSSKTSSRSSSTGRSSSSGSKTGNTVKRKPASASGDTAARRSSQRSDSTRTAAESRQLRSSSDTRRPSSEKQLPQTRKQTSPVPAGKKYTDVLDQSKRRSSAPSTRSNGKKTNGKIKKKRMSGFKKFIIIYSAILLVIIIVTCIILNSFLATYEKNQPTNVASAVVAQFETSDKLRSFLEKNSDLVNQNNAILNYEDSFVSAVDGKKISYIEDPANTTSEITTYKITADSMPVASITLVKGEKGSFGLSKWVLSGIDTSAAFSDVKTYSILVPEGSKVTVNGTELSDSMISGTGVPEVLQSSAQFIASPPTYTTYNVKVVSDNIEVAGNDSTGAALKFTQTDNSFVAGAEASQEFIDSVKDRVEAGLKSYALYFIYESFDLADYIMDGCELSAFIFGGTFDGESYDPINPWLYNYEYIDSYSFSQFEASNYVKYSDDCFTVDVKYKLDIVFTDSSYSDDNQKLDATWVWVKNGDQWYVSASKTH